MLTIGTGTLHHAFSLKQVLTNPERQALWATELCTVTPNDLAPHCEVYIMSPSWLLDFRKIWGPVL